MADSSDSGPGVFISYRRDDNPHVAGRIYDRLVAEFGAKAVFKDVDSIPAGADFRSYIRKSIVSCDVLLAVIGRRWAEVSGTERRKSVHDPQDFVRLEIEAALEAGVPAIPLLVDGASMDEKGLPETIKELAYCNGLPIRADPDFHKDVARLVGELRRYFEAGRRSAGDLSAGSTIRYPNGNVYVGELRDGRPHGYGKMRYAGGETYTGEWSAGARHGWGIRTAAGDKYAGEWHEGKALGLWAVDYGDGARYAGQWRDRSFHGLGILVCADGEIYVGDWQGGRRHGRGVSVRPDGTRYDGEWRRNLPHGWGIFTWPDGSKYCGEWQDGQMHGPGLQYGPDGNVVQSGRWESGRFVGQ